MSFYDSLHKMTDKNIRNMEFILKIYNELEQNEANNLRRLGFFTQRELTEMMLVVSGSSTSLPQAKIDEINNIFIELKQIRDALSFIEKISGKQQNKEPLTPVEEIFNEYFYMVSELSTMYKMLGNGNDTMLDTMFSVKQRDSLQLNDLLKMRTSAWWSWFRNTWSTDFLGKCAIHFPEIRGNRNFDDPKYIRKMRELQEDQTEFHEKHNLENTILNQTYWVLFDKIKDK